jgi:hypothetical protein
MSKPHLALTFASVLGCAPEYENTVDAGVHIDLEIEAGLEPCGDPVGHMDRFIELAAEAWDVDLDQHHYTYRWLTEETYLRASGCPSDSLGCAGGGIARSFSAPVDHELVHLVSSAAGRPPSFFSEGAAVAFELPPAFSPRNPGSTSIEEILASERLAYGEYMLAGAFTRYLIDRFGMTAYLDLYASLDHDADVATIAAVHEDVFTEPLDATIAAFDAERRDCDHEHFRFKLFECASPRIPWKDDTLTLHRSISCADDDVVGPFYDGPRATTYASFDLAEPGLYELSAISDGLGAKVRLASCGGCESGPPIEVLFGAGPRRIALDAGSYYLELDARTSSDTLVSLQLQRID